MSKNEQNQTEHDKPPHEIDQIIVNILIETPGITDEDLAKRIGLARQATNRRRRSKAVQRLLTEAVFRRNGGAKHGILRW